MPTGQILPGLEFAADEIHDTRHFPVQAEMCSLVLKKQDQIIKQTIVKQMQVTFYRCIL